MSWYIAVGSWLAHAALGSFLFLGIGCLAVRLCRQPIRRLRLIELTLIGCLLVPWLHLLPGLPHWSAGWLTVPQENAGLPAAPSNEQALLAEAREAPVAAAPVHLPEELAASAVTTTPQPTATAALPSAAGNVFIAPSTSSAPSPAGMIVLAYFALVGGLIIWWLLGVINLLRLREKAYPAPWPVANYFKEIAGTPSGGVRLLASDAIELPVTFGWRRPTILLPGNLCWSGDAAPLRYCLAHEWSHVQRRDVWTWYLATFAQFLFFYQPLYWWLRRQLRLCQDYLADARAAAQAAAAEDYAEYLVSLARRQLSGPVLAGLGMGDRRSNLYRRVVMLIQNREPLEQSSFGLWNLPIILGAVFLLAAIAVLRLDASDPPAAPKPAPPKEAKKESPKEPQKGETLHYTGKVTETGTAKPIKGATVTVRRGLYGDPRFAGHKIVQETKHQTDVAGKYSFEIPPDQVAERYLYIELDVEHPDYAPRSHFGYALSMIRKNEKLGGRPFFESVELRPGKPITGKVETPDGKPAAAVKVLAYSVTDQGGVWEYGSFANAKTDDQGRFRIVVTTPGHAVFWLLPEKYAPSMHPVKHNVRGDLGLFGLENGIRVRGRVLDAKGSPQADVWVNASRGGVVPDLPTPVGDAIGRSALTNSQGEFELAPLPLGTYQLAPEEYSRESSQEDRRRLPVPGVFLTQKITLKQGETPEPFEVRAVPHVVIEGQYLDSKGQPTRGHECFIYGQIDKNFWHGTARPDANGKIVALAPHGLTGAQMDLMTNEHGVLRYRKGKDAPLSNSRRVMLGTIADDVKGIEIIRYVAPILLVNATDKGGHQLKDFQVKATYAQGKSNKEPNSSFINGVQGDVYFEKQEDGRWRSSQLFPDEEVTVTVQAKDYKPRTEKLKLGEGAQKDLALALEKK